MIDPWHLLVLMLSLVLMLAPALAAVAVIVITGKRSAIREARITRRAAELALLQDPRR